MRRKWTYLLLVGLLAACNETPKPEPEPDPEPEPEKTVYYVGGDISLLQSYEDKGVA